ncbi:hypothetical protein IL54_3758 [Sphingobium sp. ba1]|nr:hypothetical protein IL54_3758 [Sphingobium sp. ba1]
MNGRKRAFIRLISFASVFEVQSLQQSGFFDGLKS